MSTYHLQLSLGKKTGRYCLFSLPRSNHYQNINALTVQPKPSTTQTNEWGNEIIITLNDILNTTRIYGSYEPLAYRKNISPSWTIKNYQPAGTKKYAYLFTPNRFTSGTDNTIRKISSRIMEKGDGQLQSVFRNAYDFVMKNLTYGRPSAGLYTYQQALSDKITDCGGFSTLLISLLLSQNIPARLVVGFLLKPSAAKLIFTQLPSYFPPLTSNSLFCLSFNSFYMHVWVEALLPDNSWFPMDPSIEWQRKKGLTQSEGGFGSIPADRLVTSFGQDFTVKIETKKYTIDVLQLPVYL